MQHARPFAALWLVALLAAGFHPPARAADLTKLNVGVLRIAGLANAYAAQKEKMFEANGLDVTLVEFPSGAAAASAQQSGAIDIALTIPGTAMTADERGFDFLAVMQNEIVYDHGPDSGSLQVRANSPLEKLTDLRGKTIAVSQLRSQNAVTVEVALKKAGVDRSEVKWIEAPYPTHADLLRSGQVDAVAATEPFTTQLITSGVGRVLSWNYAEAVPAAPLGVWFAKKRWIDRNGKSVEGFNKAIQASIDYMNADVVRARKMTTEFTGLDPALVEKMPPLRLNYHVNVAKWQEVVDMMHEAGVLEKPHRAEEYFSEQIKAYIAK